MKKLLFIVAMALFCFSYSAEAKPYHSRKNHKTVKRMTKRQVKNASKGKTFYHMKRGKIRKRRF